MPIPMPRRMPAAPSMLFCALLALISCGAGRDVADDRGAKSGARDYSAYAVDFLETDKLGEAIARAEEEGKLVFIDFYTTWCLPCKLMDEDVFTDRALGRYMNERFVSLKVDAEKGNGANLASLYNVRAYPTLVFLDTNGRVVAQKQGAAYQRELRELGDRAVASVP